MWVKKVTAVLCGGLLLAAAACSGADSGSAGDKVRYGYDLSAQFTNTFDVSKSTGDCDSIPMSFIYDGLVGFDYVKGEPLPGIATKWVITGDDKKTIDFTLRDDVVFSDGTKLDAQAVKEALERNSKNDQLSTLAYIDTMEVVGPTELKVNLENDQAVPFIYAMGEQPRRDDHVAEVVRERGDEAGRLRAIHARVLRARSRHHPDEEPEVLEQGQVRLPRDRVRAREDRSARGDALPRRRHRHRALRVVITEDDERRRRRGGDREPSEAYLQFQFRLAFKDGRKSPFANERVRQAIRYALDTEEINQIVQGGEGEVATQSLPKSSPGYDPALADAYPFDVQKAKDLLTDAGYPNGFKFTMVIPGPGIANMQHQGELSSSSSRRSASPRRSSRSSVSDIATQYYIAGGATRSPRSSSRHVLPGRVLRPVGRVPVRADLERRRARRHHRPQLQAQATDDPAEAAASTKQAAKIVVGRGARGADRVHAAVPGVRQDARSAGTSPRRPTSATRPTSPA